MDLKGNLHIKGTLTSGTPDAEVATKAYVDAAIAGVSSGGGSSFYAKMSDGQQFGDTILFDSTDFSKSVHVITVSDAGIDHGSIGGLADDDHSQYILASGTRAFTGDQSHGGFKITNLGAPTSANDAARLTDIPPGFYGLTVVEPDGSPAVHGVNVISFTNGTVTNDGGGKVSISIGGSSNPTFKDGVHSIQSATLNFNPNHFYLSQVSDGTPELNLRYDLDIIPAFVELVTQQNIVLDSFASYPYQVKQVDADCKSGTCTLGFYILSNAQRNKNGISITGLDPISVSSSPTRSLATAANTVNVGDALVVSIPINNSAKHLRISVTARAPN